MKVVECKDCKNGHHIVPCKQAKVDHELLRYVCNKIKGKHNPHFYCAYGVAKENNSGTE